MSFELSFDSEKIEHPTDLKIVLKEHQLAMTKKCIDIETFKICSFGIMSDKPGTGKSYVILALIHYFKQLVGQKVNLIVVPQNIITQWCSYINNFGDNLFRVKMFINYSDILDLYNQETKIFDYDIIITTSLFYHSIATTINSNLYGIERVFFDEIDSIAALLQVKIHTNFIWFISASFNTIDLGAYKKNIDVSLLDYITCKCTSEFIDYQFSLIEPNYHKIICKNIYLDNILSGILSSEEFKLLNARDYSKLRRKFHNKIAQNEVEAIDYLIKDIIEIIDTDKMRIEDLEKVIGHTDDSIKLEDLNKQLTKRKLSLAYNLQKIELIKDRLKTNNCCPTCYTEFKDVDKKVISPCCKNMICYTCVDSWCNKNKKESCIYCNKEEVKFEDYIIVKNLEDDNAEHIKCMICDIEIELVEKQYYGDCCKKIVCKECVDEWYNKLLKSECPICKNNFTTFYDFKNQKEHEEKIENLKKGFKYIQKSKLDFVDYFILTKIINNDSKIIIFSDYINSFIDIKKMFDEYQIKYIELDGGNIEMINKNIEEYKNGKTNVLMCNSSLYGCGMNMEFATDILFFHKMNSVMEKQIIGRCQRYGRKSVLNVWYLLHENESDLIIKKHNDDDKGITFNVEVDLSLSLYELDETIDNYTLI